MKESFFLPIGSVVFLKGKIGYYMIIANKMNDDLKQVKDYISIPYPYGLNSIEQLVVHNNSDISKILYKG